MRKSNTLALLAALFLCTFTACDDKKDNTEKEKEEYYTLHVNNIYLLHEDHEGALLSVSDIEAIISANGASLADADFDARGRNEINLPAVVPDRSLVYVPDDGGVSNTSAKWTDNVFFKAYAGARHVGSIWELASTATTLTRAWYIYVNMDVDIDFEFSSDGVPSRMNASFKKGWNRIGQKLTIDSDDNVTSVEFSNIIPSQAVWCFIPKSEETRSGVGNFLRYTFPIGTAM